MKEVLDGLVDDAHEHMRLVADKIVVSGGPNVREHPRTGETLAASIESQLAERWPWLDVAVNTNAQLIRVFLADEAPESRPTWDAWLVAQQGPKGQREVLFAAAPRLVACANPAVEPARQRALANLGIEHLGTAETGGPASETPVSEATLQGESGITASPIPSGTAVGQLLGQLALTFDYSEIERRFRAWASTQPTPPGERLVRVAQVAPYQGRISSRTGTLGGRALNAAYVDWALTSPDRLKVWCEPQCFPYLGWAWTLLGGFSLT